MAFLVAVANPVMAKTKKKAKATPTPASKVDLSKVMRLWVFEKGGEFVGDVLGIVDQKEKKIILKAGMKNLTGKEIHGARGILRFTTLFGEFICDLSLETTSVVPPGQSITIEWKAEGQRFTPEGMKKFEKLKLDQMRQTWYPRMIVFTDGTTLQ